MNASAERPGMVFDVETRDLMNLVRRRQSEAVALVVQLARDPAQAFAIHNAAATAAFGGACGAYSCWKGEPMGDPLDFADAIISLMKEASTQ